LIYRTDFAIVLHDILRVAMAPSKVGCVVVEKTVRSTSASMSP